MKTENCKLKILIGLGNPGKKYASTRHNAGRMFVDYLLKHPIENLQAIKTDCFMNDSGNWVNRYITKLGKSKKLFFQAPTNLQRSDNSRNKAQGGEEMSEESVKTSNTENVAERPEKTVPRVPTLFIAHDDLDLPLGQFKIQLGRGPRDHKGLKSIYQALGIKNFIHVRLGIDTRRNREITGEDYVLKPFTRKEKILLKKIFPKIKTKLTNQ